MSDRDIGLRTYTQLPAGFLSAQPYELLDCLGGPSLLHLGGRRSPALFVTVLLHGNEVTGVEAVQRLLQRFTDRELPRDLSIFVGNVAAAAAGVRRLDGQVDFNRVWPGTQILEAAETQLMRQVTEIMAERGCFASIDIHNNTGLNPHYACINRLEPLFLGLASLFSRTIVYFTRPRGVQSLALAELCPATTVECGQSGSHGAADHALEFIDAALHLEHVPDHIVPSDLDVYHTVAVAHISADCAFGFSADDAPLRLSDDLDELNFRELPAGTVLGWVHGHGVPVRVEDNEGADVTQRYFEVSDGELRTRRAVMPAMLTCDARAIRQDCLCYLMERIEVPRFR